MVALYSDHADRLLCSRGIEDCCCLVIIVVFSGSVLTTIVSGCLHGIQKIRNFVMFPVLTDHCYDCLLRRLVDPKASAPSVAPLLNFSLFT